MKKISIFAFSAIILASCSAEADMMEGPRPMVQGTVADQEGNPIEHIQAVLDWENTERTDTVYTSSDGIFRSAALIPEGGSTTLVITLEDIDGDKNGGLYEKATETIVLFEEDLTENENAVSLNLSFRLNPATPSESNPQS